MSFRQSAMLNLRRHPDTLPTSRVGEPTMTDPKTVSAPEFMKHAGDVLAGKGSDTKSIAIEKSGTGTPGPNQPVPRSDSQVDQTTAPPQDNSVPELPISNQAQPPAAPRSARFNRTERNGRSDVPGSNPAGCGCSDDNASGASQRCLFRQCDGAVDPGQRRYKLVEEEKEEGTRQAQPVLRRPIRQARAARPAHFLSVKLRRSVQLRATNCYFRVDFCVPWRTAFCSLILSIAPVSSFPRNHLTPLQIYLSPPCPVSPHPSCYNCM